MLSHHAKDSPGRNDKVMGKADENSKAHSRNVLSVFNSMCCTPAPPPQPSHLSCVAGQAGKLHYEAEDLRQQCVLFLQYIKVFLYR